MLSKLLVSFHDELYPNNMIYLQQLAIIYILNYTSSSSVYFFSLLHVTEVCLLTETVRKSVPGNKERELNNHIGFGLAFGAVFWRLILGTN